MSLYLRVSVINQAADCRIVVMLPDHLQVEDESSKTGA